MSSDRVYRTWRISQSTAARLKDLAAALEVYDSSVVDSLLRYALDEVAAGRLRLRRRPVAWVLEDDADTA
jgi:hypothetical protein